MSSYGIAKADGCTNCTSISEAVVNSVELVCGILLAARLHRHTHVVVYCFVSFCVVDLLFVFACVFDCSSPLCLISCLWIYVCCLIDRWRACSSACLLV